MGVGLISGERVLPYAELDQRVARAIGGLRRLGVGRGDSVAVMLRNDFPFFEAALAAGALGAYSVPVNWHYTAEEAGYVFANSDAKVIVVHADLVARVASAFPAHAHVFVVPTPPEIAQAYGIDAEAAKVPAGMRDWSQWLESEAPGAPDTDAAPATMIYTSGTTGHPKGVRRVPPTAEQIASIPRVYAQVFGFTGPDMTVLVTGPMYHSAPNAYGLIAARLRATIVLEARFDPEEMLRLVERHKVSHVHMVPTMFIRLLKLPDDVRRRHDLASLRAVPHAAAPCPPDVKKRMIEWWGPVITEYYGGTETGAVVFCNSADWLAHPGTVGKALPYCIVKVLDEAGREVPAGQSGEIYLRNTWLPDFTYHKDDAKRRASEREGLISIGDVGYLDGDGFLFLNDRKRDMIISGGVNIYPAEIESALHLFPGVGDCAVFGIPDDEFGEAVCAVIEPQRGQTLEPGAIRAFLRERIAGYMVPKRIEFRTGLPREDSGKIFKRKIRDEFWQALGRKI